MYFFYERRSGNNWYRSKHDKKSKIKQISVSKRNDVYKYLGKSISIKVEDLCQVEEMISTCKDIVEKICVCQPLLTFKVCALNKMVLSKVLHFCSNTRLQGNVVTDVEYCLTDKVRSLFMLYKSTTRDAIFLSRCHGGIGAKLSIRPKKKKKLILFSEIGRLNIFYHLLAHISRMCVRIYYFLFQKNTHKNKNIFPCKFIWTNLRFFPRSLFFNKKSAVTVAF